MNFIEALGESINRAACVVLGDAANTGELLNYVLEPLATSGTYNGAAALYAQRCGLPLPAGFTPEPAFTGGQCPTSYTVNTTYRQTVNGVPGNPVNNSFPNIPGTIKGIERFTVGTGIGVRIRHGLPGNPGGVGFSNVVFISNAQPNNVDVTAFSITSVTRTDGLPDNCGSPPAGYPPYQPGSNTVNETVNVTNNEGDTLNIPVVLIFGYATLNVDGTINIPVNADFALNPEFNGDFDFNFNTGETRPNVNNPSAPLPSPCTDPGGYTPDPTVPAPPSDIPDPPPIEPPTGEPVERERILKGCIVTTTLLDGNETTLVQQDNPDIYIPATGYVQFRVRVGNSSAWTNDVPVKSLRAFIPCPWDAGAIEVKGTPRFGNQFQITEVWVTRTFNPTYPPES